MNIFEIFDLPVASVAFELSIVLVAGLIQISKKIEIKILELDAIDENVHRILKKQTIEIGTTLMVLNKKIKKIERFCKIVFVKFWVFISSLREGFGSRRSKSIKLSIIKFWKNDWNCDDFDGFGHKNMKMSSIWQKKLFLINFQPTIVFIAANPAAPLACLPATFCCTIFFVIESSFKIENL